MVGKDPLPPLLDPSLHLSARVSKVIEAPSGPVSGKPIRRWDYFWTLIFDTIYACQDYLDDPLGRKGTKPACCIATAVQLYFLVLAGQLAGFGAPYYPLSCGGTSGIFNSINLNQKNNILINLNGIINSFIN